MLLIVKKFQKWAETLEMAIGNPLYHWSHLELQRYFGYNGILNGDTAEEVWNLCNAKLQEDSMSVRNLIKKSNVKLICTTDDPVDSLEWHKVLAADDTFDVKVLPAWRPDKAMNIEKPDYLDYLNTLSDVSGIKVNSFASLIDALKTECSSLIQWAAQYLTTLLNMLCINLTQMQKSRLYLLRDSQVKLSQQKK